MEKGRFENGILEPRRKGKRGVKRKREKGERENTEREADK